VLGLNRRVHGHNRGCGAPLNEHRENTVFDFPVVQFV